MKNEECGTNTRIVEIKTRSVENSVFSAGSRFPWLIEQKAMSHVTQSCHASHVTRHAETSA